MKTWESAIFFKVPIARNLGISTFGHLSNFRLTRVTQGDAVPGQAEPTALPRRLQRLPLRRLHRRVRGHRLPHRRRRRRRRRHFRRVLPPRRRRDEDRGGREGQARQRPPRRGDHIL